ncbi:MAG: hypothetical protein EPN88_08075 [Bacteroidetes bacterium]|nr:MAG: hypothetical protein EPN88_08075 [Bacteroidota bacterium]
MKKLFLFILVVVFTIPALTAQNNQTTKNPIGTWKFEAPYAPEGYTSGIMIVGMAEKKPTTAMSFTGSDYKLPGEMVKTSNDSLLFSIYVEGENVNVMLKIENESKMSGKAVYSGGEVPLTLTKTTGVN